jgi:hypothetical protein
MTMYDVYITYHIINESASYEKNDVDAKEQIIYDLIRKKKKIKNLLRNLRNVLNCVTNSYYM